MRPTLVAKLTAGALLVASCSSADTGPAAPSVEAHSTACAPQFCIDYPPDWRVEVGDTFITFEHPLDPQHVLGSVGFVDMRGLVEGAGEVWPASVEDAVRAFWTLLGDGQDASLDSLTVGADGTVRSVGNLEDLHLWHRLIPVPGRSAVGIEVRAPNTSWFSHVQVLRSGLTIVDQ